jgi:hypothetical protein
VEGIWIRKSRKIKKYRRMNIQPLCGEYPSWVLYLSLPRNKKNSLDD